MTETIKTALDHLEKGHLIAMPTETVYGLAADARNGQAVAKIFEAKGRPQFNPLICHVSDIEMAKAYGEFDILSERLAEIFWPAPLTLVVKKSKTCPAHDLVTADLDTIGLRAPQGVACELIAQFGHALAAPSANTSGKISPTTAQHVIDDLGDKVDYVIDGYACKVGLESTIVKVDGQNITILRAGAITANMIGAALGIPTAEIKQPQQHTNIEAPGMMVSHYAPNARVRLNVETVEAGEAVLLFGDTPPQNLDAASQTLNLSQNGNLVEAAAHLYAHMKLLDSDGAASIAVQSIPNHGLGIAINDRLTRAAAPRGE